MKLTTTLFLYNALFCKTRIVGLILPSTVAIGCCYCWSPHNTTTGLTCNSWSVINMWSNTIAGTMESSSMTIKSYFARSQFICGLSFTSTGYLNALWIVSEAKFSSVMVALYVLESMPVGVVQRTLYSFARAWRMLCNTAYVFPVPGFPRISINFLQSWPDVDGKDCTFLSSTAHSLSLLTDSLLES